MLVKESWPGNLHMDRKRHYSVSIIVYRRKSLVLIKVASWRKTITNNFGAYLCIKTHLYVFVCMCLCRGQRSTLGAFLSFFLHYFLRQKLSLNPEFTDWTRLTGQKVPGTLVALSSLHQLYGAPDFCVCVSVHPYVCMENTSWLNYLLCSNFFLILKLKVITETHGHL